MVCGDGRRGDIFGGMAVSVEMHNNWLRGVANGIDCGEYSRN